MKHINSRKALLVAVIVATAAAPLFFIRLNEATTTLSAVKVLAKIGSLAGVILLFWQLLLGFRGMLAKYIPDYIWVISLHKNLGKYAAPLILLHPVFITVYYLMKFDRNVLLLEGEVPFRWYVVFGMLALALLAMLIVTSVFVRERLSRPVWYYLHLSSYLVLPLVFVHSFPIGMTVRETALWNVWIALVLALVGCYVFRILGRLGVFSKKYEVTAAEKMAPDVTQISMRPLGKRISPEYSQFAFVRRGLKRSSRPFTISGFNDETGEIAITVSVAGQMTKELQQIQPGESMYIDGPYGVFGLEAMNGTRPVVMIAGGIGITAFKRMIKELAQEPEREAYLFYGSKSSEDIIYKKEIESLSHVEVIHVVSDQPTFEGEKGFITLELMERHLKQPPTKYEFLICGPPVMINKLEEALLKARVPAAQIHHELFGY